MFQIFRSLIAVFPVSCDRHRLGDTAATGYEVSETPTTAKTFSTEFPLTERPISEHGIWRHVGTSWRYVRSVAHHAIGTQSGSGGYDDSYAYLTGFRPDQTAQATLWIDPAIGGDYREVETVAPLGRFSDERSRVRMQPGLERVIC